MKIDLKNTLLEGKDIAVKELEKNDDDWVQYWVKASVFEAAGGSRNLTEILTILKDGLKMEQYKRDLL